MPTVYLNTDRRFLRPQQREAVALPADAFTTHIQQNGHPQGLDDLRDRWPLLNQDLNTVRFDTENEEHEPLTDDAADHLMGWQCLQNGLCFWGLYAHGDWEAPVFITLYWDGNSVRGYIPLLGNTWNPHTGFALDSGMETLDMEGAQKVYEGTQKDPDTRFMELELGGTLPEDLNWPDDLALHWPSLRFDIESTFVVK